MLLENPLCKLLSIRYPIIQAGMAGQTTPELVAAVSNAGGLGTLGVPARVLINTFVKEYSKSELQPLRWPLQRFVTNDIYENAQTKDDANYYPLYSGQGLRMLKRNQSAEEVINEIMIQAKERLSIVERQMEK